MADTTGTSAADTAGSSGQTQPAAGAAADAAGDLKALQERLAAAEARATAAEARAAAAEAEATKRKGIADEAIAARDGLKARERERAAAAEKAAKERGEFDALLKARDEAIAQAQAALTAAEARAKAAEDARATADAEHARAMDAVLLSAEWRLAFLEAGGNKTDLDLAGMLGREAITAGKVRVEEGKVVGLTDAIKAVKERKPHLFAAPQRPAAVTTDTGRAAATGPAAPGPIVVGQLARKRSP